ncbi:hypothetical protein TNCV_3828151 [Trichonephila clavipes]|nr:hypothetical protein TNCV_3828151 [Trichonephila clavipes]
MQTTEIPSILVQTKTAQALPAPPWRQVPAYYDEGSINWMEGLWNAMSIHGTVLVPAQLTVSENSRGLFYRGTSEDLPSKYSLEIEVTI